MRAHESYVAIFRSAGVHCLRDLDEKKKEQVAENCQNQKKKSRSFKNGKRSYTSKSVLGRRRCVT